MPDRPGSAVWREKWCTACGGTGSGPCADPNYCDRCPGWHACPACTGTGLRENQIGADEAYEHA